MKYETKLRHLKPFEASDGIMRAPSAEPCCMCGWPTLYVYEGLDEPFCSEECLAKYMNEEESLNESLKGD